MSSSVVSASARALRNCAHLGWRGVAQVVIHEHPHDGRYHYGDPSVRFESTAAGAASDVEITAGPGTELSQLSAAQVCRIWDAGATR